MIPLLCADGISRCYPQQGSGLPWRRKMFHALKKTSMALQSGVSLGLVGASGSGKTTLGRILAGLHIPSTGRVLFRGRDILSLDRARQRDFRATVQYVFQDPFSALNPRYRVGSSLIQPLRRLRGLDPSACQREVKTLMAHVGLEPEILSRYPHQLSGGQAQRVVISRALAAKPALLILDEPVSSLDVSIQAQILSLLRRLRDEMGLGYLLISHDLAVVEQLCSDVMVMKTGQIIKQGHCADLLQKGKPLYES